MTAIKKWKVNSKKSNNDNGATLIAAIIIMMVLIVFTFSLTLIAYTLYASQNKKVSSIKCAEAANTLSLALEDELTFCDPDNDLYPEYDSYLYRYLRCNICQDETWPWYVSEGTAGHDSTAAYRYFDLMPNGKKGYDTIEGLPGRTEVCIYWMLPDSVKPEFVDEISDLGDSREGIRLFIEVTCESASQTYTVTREYVLDTDYYKLNDVSDTSRYDYLKVNGFSNNTINPFQFTDAELFNNEKWEWKKTTE